MLAKPHDGVGVALVEQALEAIVDGAVVGLILLVILAVAPDRRRAGVDDPAQRLGLELVNVVVGQHPAYRQGVVHLGQALRQVKQQRD